MEGVTSYVELLNIIDKIQNKEDETLNLLYDTGLLTLKNLYQVCGKLLFESEYACNRYPKEKLTDTELRIYKYSPAFVESHLAGGKYSASWAGFPLVK